MSDTPDELKWSEEERNVFLNAISADPDLAGVLGLVHTNPEQTDDRRAARQGKIANAAAVVTGLLDKLQAQPAAPVQQTVLPVTEPEPEGWGWQQYAMLAGGAVVLGGAAYLAYNKLTE